jgi:hypothetical protein
MKLKKIKLQLNKETIEVLNEMQLNQVHGGTNATFVESMRQSSIQCIREAWDYAIIVDGAAKNQSWWGCAYHPDNNKSEYVPFNQKPNGQLDNTNVNLPGGAFICVKAY